MWNISHLINILKMVHRSRVLLLKILKSPKLHPFSYNLSQPVFTCSKLAIDTLEQSVKYVQS